MTDVRFNCCLKLLQNAKTELQQISLKIDERNDVVFKS